MQKLVKTGIFTEISKQSEVKFWLHWIKYGAVSCLWSCKKAIREYVHGSSLIRDMIHNLKLNARIEILILKWNYWIRTFKCVPLFSTTHIQRQWRYNLPQILEKKSSIIIHKSKMVSTEHVLKWIIDWIIIKEQIFPVLYRK